MLHGECLVFSRRRRVDGVFSSTLSSSLVAAMASCPVASAPRAAADSRRPVFVTMCLQFHDARRMISRFEGTRVLRRFAPTKASDPSALAAAELMAAGRAKRELRVAVRRARDSCIVSSPTFRSVLASSARKTLIELCFAADGAGETDLEAHFFYSSTSPTDLYGALGTALSSRKEPREAFDKGCANFDDKYFERRLRTLPLHFAAT